MQTEGGCQSYSASDGTLRFLAILAALLGTDPARLYFFEEIDNGIHPSRLRLLLDLIERTDREGRNPGGDHHALSRVAQHDR